MTTEGGIHNASTIQTFCRAHGGQSNWFYTVLNGVFNCSPSGHIQFYLIQSLSKVTPWLVAQEGSSLVLG